MRVERTPMHAGEAVAEALREEGVERATYVGRWCGRRLDRLAEGPGSSGVG